LFIKTEDPLAQGERFPITLSLPNHKEPVELHGVVKRVVSMNDAGEPGMGISFLFTDDAQRVSFFRLIDHVIIEQLGAELYQRLSGASNTETTSSMRALDSAMSTMSMESLDFD
jgi:type IV pilus assembly protein PilZ